MADAFCRDGYLRVKDIGGRDLRVILLSLEPGSRIWLSLDGDEVQFERMSATDDPEMENAYRAIGLGAQYWHARAGDSRRAYIEEIDVIERPEDRGAAGDGFYQHISGTSQDA